MWGRSRRTLVNSTILLLDLLFERQRPRTHRKSFGNVVVTGDRYMHSKPKAISDFNSALSESFQWIIDGHVDEAPTTAFGKHAQTWKGQEALLKGSGWGP